MNDKGFPQGAVLVFAAAAGSGRASRWNLRAPGGGSFVTLGSAGHLRWPDRDGLSVAPNAANEALVKGLAREEGRREIRANSILVGAIEAGMFPLQFEQGQFDQAWIDETQNMLALKRWGKTHDIGCAAVPLASDRANYITGQQLNVSGGYARYSCRASVASIHDDGLSGCQLWRCHEQRDLQRPGSAAAGSAKRSEYSFSESRRIRSLERAPVFPR
ncbi:SDR family NAD(P)-dependent oxidoreductase [Burkholderia sp. AW49-1]